MKGAGVFDGNWCQPRTWVSVSICWLSEPSFVNLFFFCYIVGKFFSELLYIWPITNTNKSNLVLII